MKLTLLLQCIFLFTFYRTAAVLMLSLFITGCGGSNEEKETQQELIVDGEVKQPQSIQEEVMTLEQIISQKSNNIRNLDDIRKSGVLRAVTFYSSTGYFLYRGETMGFEYELLEDLAAHLDLELQITVARSFLDLLRILYKGEADLIAYGLTITEGRKQYISFTDYLYLSHQVLVQRKPANWRKMKLHEIEDALIQDNVELIGKKVSVRENTPYMHRLHNLNEELGGEILIDTMPLEYDTERLIEMVVDGKISYTVADNNIASINASYYPELDIKVPMSFSQRMSWGVNKESSSLLKAVNDWLQAIKRTADFNVLYDRYFNNKKDFRKRLRSDYFSIESGKISQYDELIKRNATKLEWDWRLLCAQVYQESEFNPQAKSWAGAQGLMQLMPATAKELGVTNSADPEHNVKGGTDYLKELWDKWNEIPDSVQRIKFTLASFNCGYYHVKDAVNLAKKDQATWNVWDDNLEYYILKLSDQKYFNDPVVHYGYVRGIEPYTYVHEIFERYEHYKRFVSN